MAVDAVVKPALICPTGARTQSLSSPGCKNIFLFRNSDLPYISSRSAPSKGRIAIAVDVARNAVDGQIAVRRAASARTAKSCGSGALRLGVKLSFGSEGCATATVAMKAKLTGKSTK